MVGQLWNNDHEIIIVDNNSTYPPLLEYYERIKGLSRMKIIHLKENLGHKAPWMAGIVDTSDFYVVTDPDLDLTGIPEDWPQKCIEGIARFGVDKCGFSLDETKTPRANPAYMLDEFGKYPEGNPIAWKPLPHGFHDYPIDTTFAVYAPGVKQHSICGVRTGRPYTARHLPWHIVLKHDSNDNAIQIPMDEELYYYYKNTKSGVSVTKHRMELMIKEYELGR